MGEYTLVDVPAVESADDPQWGWAYQGMHDVEAKTYAQRYGDDDQAYTAQQLAVERREETVNLHYLKVAVVDADRERGSVIGYAQLALPKDSNKDRAIVGWCVLPDWLAAGVGHDLIKAMEAIAKAEGRSTMVTYGGFGPQEDSPPYVEAPNAGLVPIEAPTMAVVLSMGYALSQVERRSVLVLPMDPEVERSMRDEAAAHVGGYTILSWTGAVPDHLVDDLAALTSRFNTLVPSGAVEWEDTVLDAEGIQHGDQVLTDMGSITVTTVVQGGKTGSLVGSSGIIVPLDETQRACLQVATMVLPEHRGHRLGMWMKLVNLAAMREQFPYIQRVCTWNAEENGPMLSINRRMGFTPGGGSVEVFKSL